MTTFISGNINLKKEFDASRHVELIEYFGLDSGVGLLWGGIHCPEAI